MKKLLVVLVLLLSSCRVTYDVSTYRPITPTPTYFYSPLYTPWYSPLWLQPTPIIIQQTQPRRWRTKTNIQQRRNEVQPNRGRSNQQTRQPQYVRPSQPRVQQTPKQPQRTQSQVRQQTTKTTNGGRPIKQ